MNSREIGLGFLLNNTLMHIINHFKPEKKKCLRIIYLIVQKEKKLKVSKYLSLKLPHFYDTKLIRQNICSHAEGKYTLDHREIKRGSLTSMLLFLHCQISGTHS